MYFTDPEVLRILEKRKDGKKKKKKEIVIVCEICFCQTMDLTCPQASIPPGNLITKHEVATRKRRAVGKANEAAPCSVEAQ